ncbi:unnamed protein product, partial [Allacma fusca]
LDIKCGPESSLRNAKSSRSVPFISPIYITFTRAAISYLTPGLDSVEMGSKKEPVCFSNRSTNAVRLYLRNIQLKFLDITYDETVEEIEKILEDDPMSTWLCHNVLFLHMNLSEIEKVKADMKYFALINLDWDPITPKFYIDCVFHCHLHEYFLQVIYVARVKEFSHRLISDAVERVVSPGLEEKCQLTKEEWLLYMTLLPRLCCSNCPFASSYTNLWTRIVSHFVELPNQLMSVMNKVEILIRAAGIICSKVEDYKGSSEISDSIRELNFNTYGQIKEDENAQIFLGIKTRISKKTSRILRYIGDCSYLTNLILKKNVIQSEDSSELFKKAAENIQLVTNLLEKFKSKSRYEDYNERTMTFEHFCTLLRSSMKYRHSQSSWYEKFFTYEEAFTTPEGFSLAEEIIAPSASIELGLKMLKKILRIPSPLADPVKSIALTLVLNDNLYPEFDAVVKLIFKGGLHAQLCLSRFQEELNELNVKLGSEGTFCLKTRKLSSEVIRKCHRLTVQNPISTTENVLLRILQLPLCASPVLNSLEPFWCLLVPTEIMHDINMTLESMTLLEYGLVRIISQVIDPLNRNLLLKFSRLFPVLLENGFISKERFQQLIVDILTSSVEIFTIDKLASLLDIYKELIAFVLSSHSLVDLVFCQSAYNHVVGFREATYFSKFSTTECHPMRDKAIEIADILLEYDSSLMKTILPPQDSVLVNLSSIQLVLLYARCPGRREAIKCYVRAPGDVSIDVTIEELEEIVQSSSPLEWRGMLDILRIIFSVSYGEQGALKFLQLVGKVPLYEVALPKVAALEDTDDCKKRKKQSVSKELKGPSLVFQRFGSHLVDVLTSPDDPFEFGKYPSEQLAMVKVFVAGSCYFPDEPQYFLAKQLMLMSLLNLTDWLDRNHQDEQFRQQCLLITLALEKSQHGKLSPICQSIIKVWKRKELEIIPV